MSLADESFFELRYSIAFAVRYQCIVDNLVHNDDGSKACAIRKRNHLCYKKKVLSTCALRFYVPCS